MQWLYVLVISLPPILIVTSSILNTLPNYSETRKLNSVFGEITISRSEKAVPEIEANTIEDIFFALGYVHAMDRLWQIDILRRTAEGTLSEIFGESHLSKDIFARNLRFKQNSIRLSSISPKAEIYLKRYAEGINKYTEMNYLPIEYFLTWSKFRRWEPIDSICIWRYLSFTISANYAHDLLRAELASVYSDVLEILPLSNSAQFDEYFTIEGNELPREIYKENNGKRSNLHFEGAKIKINEDRSFREMFNSEASNAWVISGQFTASGKPILACDPHLSSFVPSILYLSTLKWDKYVINGGSIPGIPNFLFGSNQQLTWGSSSLLSDTLDVYSHTIINDKYLYKGTWNDFEKFTEKIKIKGGYEYTYSFSLTNNGPLLFGNSENLSIRWAADEVLDTSFDGYLQLLTANTVRSVRLSLSKIVVPSLNFIYANNEGDIGYQAVGIHPLREFLAAGVLYGEKEDHRWKKFIDFESMPYSVNPPKGFIVTANNKPVTHMYKFYESFGGEFVEGRAKRIDYLIQEKIDSKKKIKVKDMIEIQLDEYSNIAATLVPIWIKIMKNREAETYFMNWNFKMSQDSREAYVFSVWFQKVLEKLLYSKLGEILNSKIINSSMYRNTVVKSFQELSSDSISQKFGVKSCESLLMTAFGEAKAQEKPWGEVHQSLSRHFPFEFRPYLLSFLEISQYFVLKQASGGSDCTINAHPHYWNGDFGSSFGVQGRFVCDLGSVLDSKWGISTGQSGNVFSPHYSDQYFSFAIGLLEPVFASSKWVSRVNNK